MRLRWPWQRPNSDLPPVLIGEVDGSPRIYLDPRPLTGEQMAELFQRFMDDQSATRIPEDSVGADSWSLHLQLRVYGRPASFATAGEAAWKHAVRSAVHESGAPPAKDSRFRVVIRFFTAAPRRPDERWDLDNLIKPTLDAMEGVFGPRPWRGVPQPEDDRVDELRTSKEQASNSSQEGAAIQVWVRPDLGQPSTPH